MKRKIKIIDKISGKVLEKEITIRNVDHFEAQRKHKAHVFEDKRYKKPKYITKLVDYDE